MERNISSQKLNVCGNTVTIPVTNTKWLIWVMFKRGFSSMSPLSLIIARQRHVVTTTTTTTTNYNKTMWWTQTSIMLKYKIFLEKLQIPARSGRNRDANFHLDKTLIKCQNVWIINSIANLKVWWLWYFLLKYD